MLGSNANSAVRLSMTVTGDVQGVGFRRWVADLGYELGLAGRAENRPDGSVHVVAEGDRDACATLLASVRGNATPGRVDHVDETWGASAAAEGAAGGRAADGPRGFATG